MRKTGEGTAAQYSGGRKSKLTDQEWAIVEEWVRLGKSAGDIAAGVKEHFNITIGRSAIAQNRRYIRIRDEVKAQNAEEVRARLEANIPFVTDTALESMRLLRAERNLLREHLAGTPANDPGRRSQESRLRDLETELRHTVAQFSALHDSTAAKSYVDARLEDRDAKEVQDAIQSCLAGLERKLGVTSKADELLAEREGQTAADRLEASDD